MDENQGETAPKRNGSFLYSCSIWHTQHMGECFLLKHTNVKPNNTAHKQLIYIEKKKNHHQKQLCIICYRYSTDTGIPVHCASYVHKRLA